MFSCRHDTTVWEIVKLIIAKSQVVASTFLEIVTIRLQRLHCLTGFTVHWRQFIRLFVFSVSGFFIHSFVPFSFLRLWLSAKVGGSVFRLSVKEHNTACLGESVFVKTDVCICELVTPLMKELQSFPSWHGPNQGRCGFEILSCKHIVILSQFQNLS